MMINRTFEPEHTKARLSFENVNFPWSIGVQDRDMVRVIDLHMKDPCGRYCRLKRHVIIFISMFVVWMSPSVKGRWIDLGRRRRGGGRRPWRQIEHCMDECKINTHRGIPSMLFTT
jgi:hypothetical protein